MIGYLNPIEEQAINELKEYLHNSLGDNVYKIILYGSKARGDYNESSDIDLLIVVNNLNLSVSKIINTIAYDIELKYDLLISTHVQSVEHFNIQVNNSINLFMKNIIREGVSVWPLLRIILICQKTIF